MEEEFEGAEEPQVFGPLAGLLTVPWWREARAGLVQISWGYDKNRDLEYMLQVPLPYYVLPLPSYHKIFLLESSRFLITQR